MRNHLIAIQGSVASFHDLAAKKYFGEDVTVNECGSFKEVCDKIANNKVDYGIIAIENKVAGSILLNYLLIEKYDLHVIGEIYLPIELQLLGKKDSKLTDVKEIVSHPMALGQSQMFLAEHENLLVTEYKDTATCAKLVSKDSSGKLAVIGGPALAKLYNLEVLIDNVCDVKQNFTRFYILSKGSDYVSNPNKASVTMQIKNEAGSLSNALDIIKKHKLNLSKIQSLPIPNDSNSYPFHFDFEFDDKAVFEKCLLDLEKVVVGLKVLGIYKSEAYKSKMNNEINIHKNLN
jgi:prephenate dehydratase